MKKKDEILKKYNQKLSNLKKHNKFYFTDDSPKISDAEYDKLKKEIIDLEKKYDFLKKFKALDHIVGAPASNKFKKIRHLKPM